MGHSRAAVGCRAAELPGPPGGVFPFSATGTGPARERVPTRIDQQRFPVDLRIAESLWRLFRGPFGAGTNHFHKPVDLERRHMGDGSRNFNARDVVVPGIDGSE